MNRKSDKHSPIRIDLALQGGGSHGAFTWGVLDRLLEEPNLRIEGISGTSAGSINAAVLASGYLKGGIDGGREALRDFWSKVSQAASCSPLQRSYWDILTGQWNLDNSPGYIAFDIASRFFSPYDCNPLMFNPLRTILQDSIDFECLKKSSIKLFVTATNVRTGQGRVFHNAQITAEVLLASACLPMMFQAVEIDGDPYWDGGYTGNPTITPLVTGCSASDTILVQINPVERKGTPSSAREILNRINEVAFNASLMKELRMIALFKAEVLEARGECARWAKMRIHRITSEPMHALGASSKFNAEWAFLTMLCDEGRKAAELFLQKHKKDLNVQSSFDLNTLL